MYKTPREILRFTKAVLSRLIPATNYIMMDMKYRIISYFGRAPDLKWEGKIYVIFHKYYCDIEAFYLYVAQYCIIVKCNSYCCRSHGYRT